MEPAARDVLQHDRLQTLSEIGRVVSATLDLDRLYETIYEQVGRVMDTSQFFIALLRTDRETIELPYHREQGVLLPRAEVLLGGNVTSLVIERGEPLLCRSDQEYQAFAREHGLPALIIGQHGSESKTWVPLNTGNRTVGALSVQSQRVDAYTPEDLQTLSVIASQAAVAIENARLFAAQQQRVFELQAIQSIVQHLTELHEAPAIAATIERELKQLIDYHALRILALDETGETLAPIAVTGASSLAVRLKLGEGIAGWVAKTGLSAMIPNTLADERVVQIPGTQRREESMIAVPLVYQGRVRGVMTVSKLGHDQFDENAVRLLEIVAAQAAIAFDRAMLYDKLRSDATTDTVTRLYNRRHLYERFREEKSRALRNQHSLIALMLDIDKFKRVNDRYGHDAGDVVLEELASVIRAVVRAEDLVARHGGEEFCVLLPEISLDRAAGVADRLRQIIARHRLPPAAGVKRITVSVGISDLRSDDQGHEIFTRADLAMYNAKRKGGNRVAVFGEEEAHSGS